MPGIVAAGTVTVIELLVKSATALRRTIIMVDN